VRGSAHQVAVANQGFGDNELRIEASSVIDQKLLANQIAAGTISSTKFARMEEPACDFCGVRLPWSEMSMTWVDDNPGLGPALNVTACDGCMGDLPAASHANAVLPETLAHYRALPSIERRRQINRLKGAA